MKGHCGQSSNMPHGNMDESKPRFLKIIHDEVEQQRLLEIPTKFVRGHRDNLPNSVTLEVPTGASWRVNLMKTRDCRVYLDEGWSKFAADVSLGLDHSLVFKPKQPDKYLLRIFDRTGTELGYPGNPKQQEQQREHRDSPESSRQSSKIRRANEGIISDTTKSSSDDSSFFLEASDDTSSAEDSQFHESKCKKVKRDGGAPNPSEQEHEGHQEHQRHEDKDLRMKKLTASEKSEALKRITDLRLKNPWFYVFLQPSAVYVKKREARARLTIPSSFSKKYFNDMGGKIVLQLNDTWTAEVQCRIYGKYIYRLLHWDKFARENNLRVGDLCVFESIEARSFKVHIFRRNENTNNDAPPGLSSHRKDEVLFLKGTAARKDFAYKVLQKNSMRLPDNPSFTAVISSHIPNNLEIPWPFAEEHIKKNTSCVTLQIRDKSLQIALRRFSCSNGQRRCILCQGFADFKKETLLQLKDVCVFELIDKDNAVFKVSVYR